MWSYDERARGFATAAHRGQMYGLYKYTKHLEEVVEVLTHHLCDSDEALAIAWLHDVVEDTDVDLLLVRTTFTARIAEGVSFCTDPEGMPRAEAKKFKHAQWASLLHQVRRTHIFYTAGLVKLADRYANIAACQRQGKDRKLAMYAAEHRDFMAAMIRLKDTTLWRDAASLFGPWED